MSNLGISIVGSVAQGSLQAQQVSRANHRQQTDPAAEARRVREQLNAHFAALDEGDEATLLSKLRVDDQVPQREHSQDTDNPEEEKNPGENNEAIAPSQDAIEKPAEDLTHQHIDVTA